MNDFKVKRYYELKQQINKLEAEAENINKEIKEEMKENNISELVIGNYHVELKTQDHSTMNSSIVPYLKRIGHGELLYLTYNHKRFKELEKQGAFDEKELIKYRIEKIIYYLFVRPYVK